MAWNDDEYGGGFGGGMFSTLSLNPYVSAANKTIDAVKSLPAVIKDSVLLGGGRQTSGPTGTAPTPRATQGGYTVLSYPGSTGDYGLTEWEWQDIADILAGIDAYVGDSTTGGTAPFVPVQTSAPEPTQVGPNWDQGYDVSTEPTQPAQDGTGVDLGNEGVPASDVVTGGLDSPLESDNNEIGINLLLSSLGLTGAATGLMSVLAGQGRRPTRTTEAVFADLPEFTKLTPTLLSPLYRS